jgi:hypothetical protein
MVNIPVPIIVRLQGTNAVEAKRLIDESGATEVQKRIERGKLESLIGFVEAGTCRRQILLAQFGETLPEPCGKCDVCLEPGRLADVTDPARKALSAVYRTGERFGSGHVVDVLLAAGVRCTEWHLPAELREPHRGPAICHDDVLDFHAVLERPDWFETLAKAEKSHAGKFQKTLNEMAN